MAVLRLQRTIGNLAVVQLVGDGSTAVQRTPTISREGDGTGTGPGDAAKPPPEETAMFAALSSMGAGGQHAMQVRSTYGISLVWLTGGAASYDGGSKCMINSTLPAGVAAGYFVHEMYHVERKKTGASPDADATSAQARTADDATRARLKKEYVDRMVNEEIEGTVRGFESRIGQPGPLMPGEDKYRSTYNYWIKNGKDDAGAKAMGRMRVALMIRPTDGSWPELAGGKFESYEMYYRRIWDEANRPGAANP